MWQRKNRPPRAPLPYIKYRHVKSAGATLGVWSRTLDERRCRHPMSAMIRASTWFLVRRAKAMQATWRRRLGAARNELSRQMISGTAGSIEVWLWVMVAMMVALSFAVLGGIQLAITSVANEDYDWRGSRTFKYTVAMGLLFIGMGIWYRIDAHPLWVARADAIDAVNYFVDAEGSPEVLDVRVDDMPAFWWPDRPQPRVINRFTECNDIHPATSVAQISARRVNDMRPHFANIGQLLESDGWDTFIPPAATAPPSDIQPSGTFLIAFRDNKSLSISLSSRPDITHFRLNVNSTCRDKVAQRYEEN